GALERMRRALCLLAFWAACAAGVPAGAQQGPARPWQQLSPEEQRRAWENYQRYQALPEQRQRMIDRRFQQFQTLPPEQQQRLRQNYEVYRGQDPNQRREFTEKYRRWKSDQR